MFEILVKEMMGMVMMVMTPRQPVQTQPAQTT